jgi:putative endonuclease
MIAFAYMLRCRDGKYCVGSARGGRTALERRLDEHNSGRYDGFTKSHLPVELVWHQEFQRVTDAIAAERQIKGWSRAKKEALIKGDWDLVSELSHNYTDWPRGARQKRKSG